MPPATPDLTRRNRREFAWWGIVATLLVSWGVASRVQRLHDIEATEADRLQVQVRAISQNLEQQLDGVAAALRGLRADLPEWQEGELARRATLRMQALSAALPGVRTMVLVQAQGRVVADARPEDLPPSPAVAAWFQGLSRQPDRAALYVSPPFLTQDGGRAVNLAVALVAPDGRFEGAISATLESAYFETLLSSVLYAPDMTARIVHPDLSVLVATPAEARDDSLIAERVAEVFGRHLATGQPATVMRARSAWGGDRLAALRTLSLPRLGMDRPLLLGVGRSLRTLRLPWRQQTEIIAAAGLGALLASGLGLLALQRRRSEREAAAAERTAQEQRDAERLRLALHGADLALWDFNVATGEATVNERWSTMLGYVPGEPGGGSGSEWEALLHPDDRSRVLALQQDHLQGRSEHFEASYRLRHRDGHWVWVLDRGRVVQRDEKGQPLRMVGTHLDITERVHAEEELRRGDNKSRALLAALHSGVVQHAPDGRVLDANPAACRILGLSLEQMRGKLVADAAWVFMEEDGRVMQPERHPVRQVRARGVAVEDLVVGLRHPHLPQPVWALCVAFPLHGADGALEEIVVTFYDISERHRGELERRALERQLREAQKIESIGTLAGGIAHDFNNILPAILGNVALAKQDLQELQEGHPALASLEQIHTAGLRARTLVQQILTFSRRQPQALVVQPLQPVIEETLSLLRATLPAAVRLETAITPATLLVEADATQLQQVVMNLCTNAWQALPEGRGRIEVGLAQRPPAGATAAEGAQANLWVADNGSGMAPEVLERIFDPFFTTKPVGQGTGLGLSVVHGIVRSLHGSISVHSTPGQGTRFDLLLPLAAATAAEAGSSATPAMRAGRGGGERLLYVDDDEVMGLMVQRLLQREGYTVTCLVSPLQALALLQEDDEAFDLVISDFNMPEMSGTELAAQLRALRPALPVLISSGYISDDLRAQAAAQGVRALMQKEQTLEALPALVRQVLATAG